MHRTLGALATDLKLRAQTGLELLSEVSAQRLSPRRVAASDELRYVECEAQALLERGLDDPDEAEAATPDYVALSEQLAQVEDFDLPFLVRHSEADAASTALCDALLTQINWPYHSFLVGTFSCEYYWTLPPRAVICSPAGEDRRLLGIGDLCHELGHTVCDRDLDTILGSFTRDLMGYVRSHINSPPPAVGSPRDFYHELLDSWRGWGIELACDVVATYLVGPAFLWQHLRLTLMRERLASLFEPLSGEIHPADDARFRTAAAALSLMGFEVERSELEERWLGALDALGHTPDQLYTTTYPDELVEKLAESVVEGSRALGLRPYDPNAGPSDDVAVLANRAWEALHDRPSEYARWEREALAGAHSAWSQ